MALHSPAEDRRLWLVRQVLEAGSVLRAALDGLTDAIALGLALASPRWPTSGCPLDGRTLLLYTDGLIEGHVNATRERFGIERLLRTLAERGTDPERLCRTAIEANRGPLPDDVAILRLRPAG